MIDRNKVVEGLECCARSKSLDKCDQCPYFFDCLGEAGACARIASEALELIKILDVTPEELERLKLCRHECKIDCLLESYNRVVEGYNRLLNAQKPRLVIKEDFNNPQFVDEWGYMPVWREKKNTGELICECIVVGAVDPDVEGGKWPYRYWTVKPSKELMEATPWKW